MLMYKKSRQVDTLSTSFRYAPRMPAPSLEWYSSTPNIALLSWMFSSVHHLSTSFLLWKKGLITACLY